MTQQWPKISIITPSYNQGTFIRETIESVLSQNYPNLEYWVIDGGSTDDTVSILKSYGSQLHWISEKDNGQTDAINKGLARVTGDIIAYLNSDDIYLPGTLEMVATTFIENPQALWISSDGLIINARGREIQRFVRLYKTILRFVGSAWLLAIANYIVQPSTFWRARVHAHIGQFDTSLRYCMDYDFWLRLSKYATPHFLARPLACFRIHGESKGGAQFEKQFIEEYEVARRHTTNGVILLLHKLHASAILCVYRMIK